MPPAVDADPPPTNMSASLSSQVPSCICPMSTVENPAERGMTPAKSDARTVAGPSSLPKVRGLVHSNAATSSDPAPTRARLVTIVSLACRFQRRGLRRWRATSRITGKPSDPMNTPMMMGSRTHQSETYGARPSAVGTKPALLKADTA